MIKVITGIFILTILATTAAVAKENPYAGLSDIEFSRLRVSLPDPKDQNWQTATMTRDEALKSQENKLLASELLPIWIRLSLRDSPEQTPGLLYTLLSLVDDPDPQVSMKSTIGLFRLGDYQDKAFNKMSNFFRSLTVKSVANGQTDEKINNFLAELSFYSDHRFDQGLYKVWESLSKLEGKNKYKISNIGYYLEKSGKQLQDIQDVWSPATDFVLPSSNGEIHAIARTCPFTWKDANGEEYKNCAKMIFLPKEGILWFGFCDYNHFFKLGDTVVGFGMMPGNVLFLVPSIKIIAQTSANASSQLKKLMIDKLEKLRRGERLGERSFMLRKVFGLIDIDTTKIQDARYQLQAPKFLGISFYDNAVQIEFLTANGSKEIITLNKKLELVGASVNGKQMPL